MLGDESIGVSAGADPTPSRWRDDWRRYVALVAATLAYCPLLFSNLDHYGRRDWDQFTVRYETPRLALLRDRQLPLWNPYVNGGTVLLAHPHSPVASPWYAIVLALGAPLGLRVQVVLFMALGATGLATLLRRWNVPPAGCFVGGVMLMMSSHFALHIAEGHLEWCVLGLMPWLVLCVLRIAREPRFIIVAALLLASVLTFGSVYVLAVYVPFLTVWLILESVRTRQPRLFAGWCGVLVLAALLSAVKLLPQWEFTGTHPRDTQPDGFSPAGLQYVLFDPRQVFLYRATRDVFIPDRYAFSRTVPPAIAMPVNAGLAELGLVQVWHEYGCYVTWLGLALAGAGLVAGWRTQWPLYAAGGLALLTAMGNQSPVDLWSALQELPLYGSMRVPSRFLAAVVLVLATAAGIGLGWLCRVTSRKSPLHAAVKFGIPLVIFAELAVMGWRLFGDIFVCPPARAARSAKMTEGQDFAMRVRATATYFPTMTSCLYPHLLANSGVLQGYENLAVEQGRVRTTSDPDYRGEIWLAGARGSTRIASWTMARVRVAVQVDAPGTLVLNQNHAPGWRATIDDGRSIRTEPAGTYEGLVAAAVRPGDRVVDFHYSPGSFDWGAWCSGVTLAGCVAGLVAARFGRSRAVRPPTRPEAQRGATRLP